MKITDKKRELVNSIIYGLKDNIFESEDYIFDLCREALYSRTIRELKEINI